MRRRRKRKIKNEFGVLLQTLRWGGEHGELCTHDRAPDLYIITTARKRDTGEWDEELAHFYMSTDPEHDIYEHKVVVDSWNNIGKYVGVKNAFFIFDEQRVVGKGAWVKSFYKITQNNEWILLSATPGTAGRIISRCSSPMGSTETERTLTTSTWYTANSVRSTRRSIGI